MKLVLSLIYLRDKIKGTRYKAHWSHRVIYSSEMKRYYFACRKYFFSFITQTPKKEMRIQTLYTANNHVIVLAT